ncbi:hypothetical protein ABIB57_003655 [Devosia sp. UYZn731]|uniref:hypothetical protein n=1 Tax=Devosia sp. UYZn731 TaxID=3156345 RepID=UPI003396D9EF
MNAQRGDARTVEPASTENRLINVHDQLTSAATRCTALFMMAHCDLIPEDQRDALQFIADDVRNCIHLAQDAIEDARAAAKGGANG